MSNEKNADEQLTVTDGSVALIKLPETIGEAMAHAKILMRGELIPKEYRGHLGNVYTAIQFGAQFGLLPNQSLQRIAVINGRPSLWGDAMLGIIEATGQLSEFEESDIVADGDAAGARCFVHRVKPDGTARKRTCDFTIADAKKAGLWTKQGPWQTSPKRMMQLRARAFCLRDTFSDVLTGLYSAEEARDIPPDIVVEALRVEDDLPKRRQGPSAPDPPAAVPSRENDANRTTPAKPAGPADASVETGPEGGASPGEEARPHQTPAPPAPQTRQPPPAPDSPAAAEPATGKAHTTTAAQPAEAARDDLLGDALDVEQTPAQTGDLLPPAPAGGELISRHDRGRLILAAGKTGQNLDTVLAREFGVSDSRQLPKANLQAALELFS